MAKEDKLNFKFSDLFTDRIWTLPTEAMSLAWKRIVRFVKLARITLDTFAQNRIGFQCQALSYFTTMAIVPLLAFIFAVSGGLGMADKVSSFLNAVLPAILEESIVEMVVDKAGNIIDAAKSGPVGVVSALTFFWTIIWLMFQVERVFNNVWGIRKIPRNIFKRFGFYIGLMVLIPFIMIIFGYGIAIYTNASRLVGLNTDEMKYFSKFISWLVFYAFTVLTLSAMYKFIPAVKVKYKFALKAALFDAIVFVAFQYLYLETQVFVGRLNAVYGVLAAIPLFLLWLNFSWQIIMYGAELTYGYHNVDSYHIPEWETDDR